MQVSGAFVLAAAIFGVARADDIPTSISDQLPHVSIQLPFSSGDFGILRNSTFGYEWRRAFAAAAGDSATAPYFLIMGAEDSANGVSLSFSDFYDTNNLNPAPPSENGGRRLAFGARALQSSATPQWTVTTWYLYGQSYTQVAAAKGANVTGIVATITSGLQDSANWAQFASSGAEAAVGVNVTTVVAAATSATFETTLPRLPYQPFGPNWTGTSLGSVIGIAVFVITVGFVSIPSVTEYINKRRLQAKKTAAAGRPTTV